MVGPTDKREFVKAGRQGASQFLNTCEKFENSCGAASEDSPRREPWGTCWEISKPRQGRKKNGGSRDSFAAPRLLPALPQPTACAVGYLLSPLRGWETAQKLRCAL